MDFEAPELAWGDGAAIWRGRGQNFLVEWVDCAPGAELLLAGEHETILIMPDANFEIRWAGKPGMATAAPSVAITPVGEGTVTAPQGGTVIALSPQPELAADVIDAGIYATPDRQVAAIGAPYERVGAQDVQIVDMARLRPPADRPRLRVLQSASMSINWVVYEGPRNRSELSPHAHKDFEQGSLAIHGQFVHHLRRPWGTNADLWRADVHHLASERSLLVVPPDVIHTTEGVGEGRHLLIDIFAPPREDFIASGWIANSGNYRRT